jgi:hypothetical protein
LRFQLRYPQGNTEQIHVEAERALIGSGAHCDIRLPLEDAAVEHVLVQMGAGTNVFASALSFEPPPTMNSIPFTQAPLPPESVLGVGQVQIVVQALDLAPGQIAGQEKKKRTSPLVVVVLLALIGVWSWILLSDPPAEATAPKPPKEVELWGPAVTQCGVPRGEQALAIAREKRAIADAKRERRPFHVQDGVAAVPLYELAAVCFKAGGDIESSNQAYAAAAALRRELSDDYRTQRVRLEHALSVNDSQSAQREVKILLMFTEGKQGDYVVWLSNLDRKLRLKLGTGGQKP